MSTSHALPPSRRGRRNVQPDLMIDLSRRLEQDQYHPSKNPKGIIDLGSAVNELMLEDIASWTRWNLKKGELKEGLGYNDTQGSSELLKAAADFMNEHFNARIPLTSDNILVANGATTLLDTLTYNIADEGDSILLPTPSYGMFAHDISTRNQVRLVEVPCDDIPDDRFTGQSTSNGDGARQCEIVARMEDAIEKELSQGRKVAGVLLANPENPLVHLVVDEIYAMTGDNFSSMLSLGLDTNFRNVHVLWGMSKDFGLGGLRTGFLATYNQEIHDTMRTLSMFGWVSSYSATIAAKLLSDKKYFKDHYTPTFNRRLKKRRILVEGELDKYDIPYMKANSGFFMFVDLSDWMDLLFAQHGKDGELELLEHLMENGVFLEPGKVRQRMPPLQTRSEPHNADMNSDVRQAFFARAPGWFRLSFGGEKHTVKTGLQRLFRCLRALDGKPDPLGVADLTPYLPPYRQMAHIVAV
ncbi:aminotransferase class I and II [Colletotrichum camelliae]|nr:aminotransferase class I and II [Colletotrichum camelliae]